MQTVHKNKKGNRVLKVYDRLMNSATYFEAELFIDGVTQGLEAITAGQIARRYPIFISGTITGYAKLEGNRNA